MGSLYLEYMTDGKVRQAKATAEAPSLIELRGKVDKKELEEQVNKIKKAQEAQFEEYLQDKEARNKKAFAVLDVNGDGKLQEQEVVDALTLGHDKYWELHEALGLMSETEKRLWQAGALKSETAKRPPPPMPPPHIRGGPPPPMPPPHIRGDRG